LLAGVACPQDPSDGIDDDFKSHGGAPGDCSAERWKCPFPLTVRDEGLRKPSPHGSYPWPYSTVTDLARLRGLSTSVPRASAVWYARICTGMVCTIGLSTPTWRGARITCTPSDGPKALSSAVTTNSPPPRGRTPGRSA